MKRHQFLTHAISALAVTWVISGTTAAAQMPLLIDEILMTEYGNQETTPDGTAVAVDEAGRWLTLRTSPDSRARRDENMAELLEFDSADFVDGLGSTTNLSAEDYRYPSTESPASRLWGYDGDPLDRGAYKRELSGSSTASNRSSIRRSRGARPAGRSTTRVAAAPSADGIKGGRVIAILVRAPRYVMDSVRSMYRSENAMMYAIGLMTFVFGLAAFMDLLAGSRRA